MKPARTKGVNTRQTPEAEYVSLGYAAAYFDMSERSVRRMVAEGLLPAVRVGKRQIRVRRTDLELLARPIPTAG